MDSSASLLSLLTPQALKVLAVAADIAAEQDSPYVASHHILGGMVRCNHGISGFVLSEAGITQRCIIDALSPQKKPMPTINDILPPRLTPYPY